MRKLNLAKLRASVAVGTMMGVSLFMSSPAMALSSVSTRYCSGVQHPGEYRLKFTVGTDRVAYAFVGGVASGPYTAGARTLYNTTPYTQLIEYSVYTGAVLDNRIFSAGNYTNTNC